MEKSIKSKKYSPVLATNTVLARFLENLDKMMDKAKLNYSPAFIYEKQGYFRIIFYWRSDVHLALIRFRKSYNVNRIKDLKARKQAADILAATVTKLLKAGWHPVDDSIPTGAPLNNKPSYMLPDLLEKALDNILARSDKQRTHSIYRNHFKHFASLFKEVPTL